MRRRKPGQPGLGTEGDAVNKTAADQSGNQVTADKIRRLELVSELFNICNSTSNLNELMNLVFNKVVSDVGAEAGSLWLIDDNKTEITCHVAEGPTKDKIRGMKLPKGTGVVGYVIDSGECQTVFDTSKDSRFATSVDQKTGFKTLSMICAPLIVENSAIGAIQLLNKKTLDGHFVNEDLNLLKMLCQSSATPIVNARLSASQQKVQELSVLLDISKEITGTLDLDGCMLTVVNLCSKLIPYDRAAIALEDKGSIKISAISGKTAVNHNDPDIINLKNMLDGVNKKKQDVYIPSGKKYVKSDTGEPYIMEYINRYHPGTVAVYRLFDEESELGVFMMESRKENLIPSSMFDRIA
ncbi:MAG: GAF domain-containing protein, partial [bacterium]